MWYTFWNITLKCYPISSICLCLLSIHEIGLPHQTFTFPCHVYLLWNSLFIKLVNSKGNTVNILISNTVSCKFTFNSNFPLNITWKLSLIFSDKVHSLMYHQRTTYNRYVNEEIVNYIVLSTTNAGQDCMIRDTVCLAVRTRTDWQWLDGLVEQRQPKNFLVILLLLFRYCWARRIIVVYCVSDWRLIKVSGQ